MLTVGFYIAFAFILSLCFAAPVMLNGETTVTEKCLSLVAGYIFVNLLGTIL